MFALGDQLIGTLVVLAYAVGICGIAYIIREHFAWKRRWRERHGK
jgi:hypothetical protein